MNARPDQVHRHLLVDVHVPQGAGPLIPPASLGFWIVIVHAQIRGLASQLQALFAGSEGFLRLTPLRDIDEGDHDAFDLVLDRAVGTQAHEKP